MSRNLSAEIQTRLAADAVRPVYLVYFDFSGAALRLWTGQGSLSYDSQTWLEDAGQLQNVPNVLESISLQPQSAEFALSGDIDYTVDLTNPTVYRGRMVEMYLGFLETDGTLPATNVYKIFSGRMSNIDGETTIDGGMEAEKNLVVQAESRLIDLQQQKKNRYTHQDQLSLFPGDLGLQYAATAQSKLFYSRGEVPEEPFTRQIIYGEDEVDGRPVFVGTSGDSDKYLNLVVAWAGHECESIEQVYLDDRPLLVSGVVGGEFVGIVNYYQRLGTDTQTYFSELETEMGATVWTSAHQLKGICCSYLRIQYSVDLFGDSAPAITALIRGKKLYDPRTTNTVWSVNPALAVRDYLISPAYGFGAESTEINDDDISIAANDCDILVALAGGGTEAKYRINGVLDTKETIGQNLKTLIDSMAGRMSYISGEFSVLSGVYQLQPIAISADDVLTGLAFSNLSQREIYNGAKGLYAPSILDWRSENYPAYQNATLLAEDDNEPRWLNIDFPLTKSSAMAQRLAKIATMRTRNSREVQVDVKLSKFLIKAGIVITLAMEDETLGAVPYEVQSVEIVNGLPPYLRLVLRETSAPVFAWSSSEENAVTPSEEFSNSIVSWTNARLSSPSATPPSGPYTIAFNATVSVNQTGATCHYTTNGDDPDEADPTVANGGTISISGGSVTLKLKSFEDAGPLESNTVTYNYEYVAPTDSVPNPEVRITADGPEWRISGLAGCALRVSSNSGVSYTTLAASTVNGQWYAQTISQPWTPSNYRAYGTKAGYLQSNWVVAPNQLLAPDYTRLGHNIRLVYNTYNQNNYVYSRRRTKYGGDPWGSWTAFQAYQPSFWDTALWNMEGEDGFLGIYVREREFYFTLPGWSNSDTILVTA